LLAAAVWCFFLVVEAESTAAPANISNNNDASTAGIQMEVRRVSLRRV